MIAFGGWGCTQARYVQKTESEGVVAVSSNSDMWPMKNRTKAIKLIEQHVGADYEIVEESEVVTGQQASANSRSDVNTYETCGPPGQSSATTFTGTTTTVPATEYQIRYRERNRTYRPMNSWNYKQSESQHLTPERVYGDIL